MPTSSQSRPPLPAGHFLALPPELRIDIYQYYLHLEGGYVYNFHTRNVSAARGDERLDLSLQFVCKRIYNEMRGLPFSTNVVHFYPVDSAHLRITAARFQSILRLLDRRLEMLVWPNYVFHPYFFNTTWSREHHKAKMNQKRREDYEAETHPDGQNAAWATRSRQAWRHSQMNWRQVQEDPRTLQRLRDPEVSLDPCDIPLLTQAIVDEVVLAFPEMRHLLLLEPVPDACDITALLQLWGTGYMPDSRRRLAAIHTVRIAIKQGRFTGPVADYARTLIRLSSGLQPWEVPSTAKVDSVLKELRACGALNSYDYEMGPWGTDYWKHPGYCPLDNNEEWAVRKNIFDKFRLSAATAGIHLLQSLPDDLRLHVRTMVLHENATSTADPECHALGFIPFCQANSLLKVERRVDLWRSALQQVREERENPQGGFTNFLPRPVYRNFPRPDFAARAVERWISEALSLETAGMPSASFSLVLEGDDLRNEYSLIFEALRLDAVYMLAAEEANARNTTKRPAEPKETLEPFYTVERWPEVIKAIASGTAVVRCDFAISPVLPTIEQILNDPKWPGADPRELISCKTRMLKALHTWGMRAPDLEGYPHLVVPSSRPQNTQKELCDAWDDLQEENVIAEFFTSEERLRLVAP